jgi:3-deoxy-7-phosphoheptulonate synthase
VSISITEEQLISAGLPPLVMVDCSHDNSGRRPRLQAHVLKSVLQQRLDGNTSIVGVMIESNLEEGNQPLAPKASGLRYGLSITDPCLGWETTRDLLLFAHKELTGGKKAKLRRSIS